MATPKNLREVKEGNSDGYKLMTGYCLALTHGLMGFFPALISEKLKKDGLFVCVDKGVLEKVWERIEKREAHLIEKQLYISVDKCIAFDTSIGDSAEPIHVLSEDEFNELIKEDDPFMWAPGLFSLKDEGEVESPFN